MSSFQTFQTNLGDNNTKASTTGKCGSTSQTKGKVNEDSEMNLFLSDESSGNDIDEASGEASGETSNGNSSNSEKSKSSISTTEAWFREFNQNTKELNKSNFDDDDSETPYYKSHPKPMSNQQSSVISRHHQHSQRIGHHARIPPNRNIPKSPRHGNFHKKRGESSESDSYRSVIDDLTLKNQKLRQKLRKLERIHAKSLHKEKLFEVRYYQMPSEKRHELEEYLRQFAAQLSTPNSSSTQLTQNSTNTNDSSIGNDVTPDISYIKAGDKSKMKQVVRAIENVFTTKPSLDDHYLKDQEDADPQGYVYLNLLTNMAQLHTMSVTLPFVKQAIRTFSNCLELNEDGTKVRWLTGLDHVKPDQFSANKVKDVDIIGSGGSSENTSRSGVSEISSAGDKQSDFSPSNPSAEFQNSKNFTNAYITPSSLTSSNTSTAINQQTKSTSSISHYRPVLIHRSSSSSDETSSETDHDGPVIYYEGGLFCTDLSRNVITDDVKQTHSPGTQSSPGLDNSIVDDNNIDISEERRNVPHYERATNSILGGSGVILNETIDEDSCSGQEADDESQTKLCDKCGVNDHDSLICPHMSIDDPKLSMIAVDDSNENSKDTNDGINRILMEKDIEFTHRTQSDSSGKNYGEINEWNEDVSKNSSSSPTSHSNQYIPAYKKLFTAKVPGITTEDNFMLLVQTSHPPRGKISRSKESSVDSSISSIDMGQQKNEKSQRSHKIISTKLFQLPPSMSPQPRTSPPPGVKRTSFTTSSKTSSSDSGGSSGYGSSSSYSNTFSESSSATSRDNSYLLRNNTLLQLSQSNNSNRRDLVSSQDDEIQDMELDSLSSDSSDPSPFINIDADEDDEMETKDDENHNHRIEESKLGMDLRFHDAVVEERRKLADKVAPQEQRFRLLNDIMASSRAMVEALKDNKNDNDVIDGGMDSLPTIPLPFFNQQYNYFDQQQSNSGGINNFINGINGIINQNNNYNNNNNNNNNNNAL